MVSLLGGYRHSLDGLNKGFSASDWLNFEHFEAPRVHFIENGTIHSGFTAYAAPACSGEQPTTSFKIHILTRVLPTH